VVGGVRKKGGKQGWAGNDDVRALDTRGKGQVLEKESGPHIGSNKDYCLKLDKYKTPK
jgi:hypothetical protein